MQDTFTWQHSPVPGASEEITSMFVTLDFVTWFGSRDMSHYISVYNTTFGQYQVMRNITILCVLCGSKKLITYVFSLRFRHWIFSKPTVQILSYYQVMKSKNKSTSVFLEKFGFSLNLIKRGKKKNNVLLHNWKASAPGLFIVRPPRWLSLFRLSLGDMSCRLSVPAIDLLDTHACLRNFWIKRH